MRLEILYEDEQLIACIKPCGVPAQGDKTNDEDMVSIVKNYIFDNSDIDEEPYLAIINRLDRPVGGIVVFAKNQAAAANLSEQVQNGTMVKYYQAILTGELPEDGDELVDYLIKDPKTNLSKVVSKETKGAKKARLFYEILDVFETDSGIYSYVLIQLDTGRHHQIRVQTSNRNAGIWGDTKYNPLFKINRNKYKQMGLYASRIELIHPMTKKEMIFKSEPTGEAFDIIELDEF